MRRSLIGRSWPNIVAVVLFAFFAFPVYWMVTTAFKQNSDIISKTPVFLPLDGTLEHFSKATGAAQFWEMTGNSLIATIGAVLASLVIATLASFAISRMKFRGRKGFVLVIMMAQMAPWEVMTISIYLIVRDQGMLNSLVPLLLFYTMMVLPFTIWTLRGHGRRAQGVGGVGDGGRLHPGPGLHPGGLPAAGPGPDGHLAVRLHHRVERAAAHPDPQQVDRARHLADPAALADRVPDRLRQRLGATMAASTLFAIPILLVFLILQRKAVGGLTAGAVKG